MKATEIKPDGTRTEIDTGDAPAAKTVWDGETIAARVLKADDERRYTLNVIYPADKADVATALDGHRDFASKAVVEDAAWNYMRHHREVGTYHTAVTGQGIDAGAGFRSEAIVGDGGDEAVAGRVPGLGRRSQVREDR